MFKAWLSEIWNRAPNWLHELVARTKFGDSSSRPPKNREPEGSVVKSSIYVEEDANRSQYTDSTLPFTNSEGCDKSPNVQRENDENSEKKPSIDVTDGACITSEITCTTEESIGDSDTQDHTKSRNEPTDDERSNDDREVGSEASAVPLKTDDIENRSDAEKRRRNVPKPPIDAPGRRTERSPSMPNRKHGISRPAKPELCCRRNAAKSNWQILVVRDRGLSSVMQDGVELPIDKGESTVKNYDGSLTVSCDDLESKTIGILDDANVAVFKMPNRWEGYGRKVERITRGFYIVIAPTDYSQLGLLRHESEICEDERFAAYYFYIDPKSEDLDSLGFAECPFSLGSLRFNLEGESLVDQSEMGDLYVSAPPTLNVDTSIEWARVGEEKENGWRGQNFNPHSQTLEKVLNGRQGRFYLRVYDGSSLVDSCEFRYLEALREIQIDGVPVEADQLIVPGPDGHNETKLAFVLRSNANLHLEFTRDHGVGEITGNTVVVAPVASADQIDCVVSDDDGEIGVTIKLPRVWWCLTPQTESAETWLSVPLSVSRTFLREQAFADTCVLIRVPKFVRRIKTGVNGEIDRSYRRESGVGEFRIPLLDFIDYEEIAESQFDEVMINVAILDTVVTVLKIEAEPRPSINRFRPDLFRVESGESTTLRWSTDNAIDNHIEIKPDIGPVGSEGSIDIAPGVSTTYTIELQLPNDEDITATTTVDVYPRRRSDTPIALVKRRRIGWRRGRGFSVLELESAGLSTDTRIRNQRIPLDPKRRTVHARNVNTLKEFFNA